MSIDIKQRLREAADWLDDPDMVLVTPEDLRQAVQELERLERRVASLLAELEAMTNARDAYSEALVTQSRRP